MFCRILFVFTILLWSSVWGQTFSLLGNSPYSTVGSEHVFYCNLTGGGFPGASQAIQFFRNDNEICSVDIKTCAQYSTYHPRFSCGCINNNNTRMRLNISEVRSEDEDDWLCRFRLYNIKSPQKHLPLYYGPGDSIVILPFTSRSHTVNEGNSLTPISCSATCKPGCYYTWYKTDVFTNHITNSSVLYLTNAVKMDEGIYICQASNIIDSNTSSISVYVHEKRPIMQESSTLTFGVGIGVGIVICAVVMITGMAAGVYCYRKTRQKDQGRFENDTVSESTYMSPQYEVPSHAKHTLHSGYRPNSYDQGFFLSPIS